MVLRSRCGRGDSATGGGEVVSIRSQTKEPLASQSCYSALIADDCVSLAEALAQRLAIDGFTVWTALSVADALRLCSERSFDLVLVDLSLPDGSGLEIASHVRDCRSPSTVAVMSGYSLTRRSKRLRDCVDAVLVKPWRHADLQRILAMAKQNRADASMALLAGAQ